MGSPHLYCFFPAGLLSCVLMVYMQSLPWVGVTKPPPSTCNNMPECKGSIGGELSMIENALHSRTCLRSGTFVKDELQLIRRQTEEVLQANGSR